MIPLSYFKGVRYVAKTADTGLFQLENGCWAYRIVINRKDLKVDTTCRQDDLGNPFKTKKAAKEARELKLVELKAPKPNSSFIREVKLSEVYEKYIESGAVGKAASTITKQKSMWDNHIKKNFGDKYLSEITLEDLNNYLQRLYTYGDNISTYEGGYAYKYVESFLKFFYLLFGRAYNDDLISTERYTKMFLDRGSRLTMPKMTQEDADEEEEAAKAYTMAEILKIEEVFKQGHCYTAYMLGFYLGVRISECFALRWSDIQWDNKTITVDKQMLYQDGSFCLVPVKTLMSSRVIDMPEVLFEHLKDKELNQGAFINRDVYRNTEVVLDKTKSGKVVRIVGGAFINRKDNGELLTINSLKYWTNKVKKETGIDFKYHGLRKTHATIMASQNTPVLELMGRLGHRKYDTTLSYYVNQNHLAKEQLKRHINNIDLLLVKERQSIEEGKQWYDRLPDFEKGLLGNLSDIEKAKLAQQDETFVDTTDYESLDKLLKEYKE